MKTETKPHITPPSPTGRLNKTEPALQEIPRPPGPLDGVLKLIRDRRLP